MAGGSRYSSGRKPDPINNSKFSEAYPTAAVEVQSLHGASQWKTRQNEGAQKQVHQAAISSVFCH